MNNGDRVVQLVKAIMDNDLEKQIFLMKDMTPLEVRDFHGAGLSELINASQNMKGNRGKLLTPKELEYNSEKIKSLFANKERLKNTEILTNRPIGDNSVASYLVNEDKVLLRPQSLTPQNTTSNLVHEFGHARDVNQKADRVTKNLIESMFDTNKNADLYPRNTFGLSSAEKVLENHHLTDDILERGALTRFLKGKKLSKLPFVGPALAGGLTMLATGDASAAASAATPILGEADDLGPMKGSLESDIQDPSKNYLERAKAAEQLKIEQNRPRENLGKISDAKIDRRGQLASELGPLEGSFEAMVEDPTKSYEQRQKAIQELSKRRY